MRYIDCQREDGDCTVCSLSSYNRDCRNNPINNIAYYRTIRGFTQQGLAKAAEMHYKQIQKLEWGQIDPANMTLKNGLSLANALKIEPAELLNK